MEDSISAFAARRQPGYSLEQSFYTSREVYDADLSSVIHEQWLLADHVSRIPERGNFFLFDIGEESIVILRESEERINAFFNVCRHRGSRVCVETEGKKNLLVCPYHSWSYGLDGTLRSAPLMAAEFDKSSYGLHNCNVQVFHGFIFVCLGDTPPDFDVAYSSVAPFMDFHQYEQAKIAAKINYPTKANWKLVVENFSECYHCASAHPEYCSVHPPAMLLAFGAGPDSGPDGAMEAVATDIAAFEERCLELGHPSGFIGSPTTKGGATPSDMTLTGGAMRLPIGNGAKTESPDGEPISSLMGKFTEYDGGQTIVVFNPVSYVISSNDFAVSFRFTPRGPMETDVELTWFVSNDAEEGKDYEIDRLIYVWDETTKQDKKITEDNQAGILSSRYKPGPYSQHENDVERFIQWYLSRVR